MPPLTPQAEDFPQWYQEVIQRADLADNGPVRGTMAIFPYAYAMWERLQREFDERFAVRGVRNCYFPMFIPYSFLEREAETIAGFSPELAVVTHGGGKELAEPLVVRPTSETIINHFFGKRIQGHSDLPVLWNQWTNVVRWEQRPRLFLRTTEFLWQEGHTCHAGQEEAQEFAYGILNDAYIDVMTTVMAIPVFAGRKTADERFPGAINTLTCEGLMRDGKALQMGTSHELGQTFAAAFGVDYLTHQGTREYVWQTSWGVSTRLLGALVMAHGDDHGLRVPPAVAPTQVVVLAVRDGGGTIEAATRLAELLRAAGVRTALDVDLRRGFGRRVTDWELQGVPLRVHIGPKEVETGRVDVVRRDTMERWTETPEGLLAGAHELLKDVQASLHRDALEFREKRTVHADSVAECVEAVATNAVAIPYALLRRNDALDKIKSAQASVRCLVDESLGVPHPGANENDLLAVVARAY